MSFTPLGVQTLLIAPLPGPARKRGFAHGAALHRPTFSNLIEEFHSS